MSDWHVGMEEGRRRKERILDRLSDKKWWLVGDVAGENEESKPYRAIMDQMNKDGLLDKSKDSNNTFIYRLTGQEVECRKLMRRPWLSEKVEIITEDFTLT